MKNSIFISSLLGLLILTSSCKKESATNIMVVAGGHSYDTTEFVEMFKSYEGITFDTVMQPHANQLIAEGNTGDYDVIVFYDMWPLADEAVRSGYLRLLEEGKGLVFLHHALVSYQEWEEFKNIIGGKYYAEWSDVDSSMFSTYKHDIDIDVKILSKEHPLTASVSDFTIQDEGYGNIIVNDEVTVFLGADHLDCAEYIGWNHSYGNSKIVYLMLGHDKQAYQNKSYMQLLHNAIAFVR